MVIDNQNAGHTVFPTPSRILIACVFTVTWHEVGMSALGQQRPNEAIDIESALTSTPDRSLHRTDALGQEETSIFRNRAIQTLSTAGGRWPSENQAPTSFEPLARSEL